jgi:hypothetical protein
MPSLGTNKHFFPFSQFANQSFLYGGHTGILQSLLRLLVTGLVSLPIRQYVQCICLEYRKQVLVLGNVPHMANLVVRLVCVHHVDSYF